MKKRTYASLALIVALCIAMATLVPVQAMELRYIGTTTLDSSLEISSKGSADCFGTAELRTGYTGDLKVELKRNGTTIKTWTDSGSGVLDAGGTYNVMSGYNYIVKTTVTVYNSAGKIVESPSCSSEQVSY